MKKISAVLLLSIVLFSCKKEKDEPAAKSKTTLLTQSTWKATKVERRSTATDPWVINNFSNDPCNTDNISSFTTGFVYNVDDGALKCNPANAQTVEAGTYSFASNETHLNVIITTVGFNMEQDWAIEELDENTFIYNYFFPNTGPYYRVTMGH